MNMELSTEIKREIVVKTDELLAASSMPKSQIKREMDINFLQMLVERNPTLDKKDFVDFITKCQLSGADPRLNQIYLIVHDTWNSQTQTKSPKGTTVFSYQFFLKLAQQTGQLEAFDVETKEDSYLDFQNSKTRKSLTATATAKRTGHETTKYRARLWEFAKTDKTGNLSGNWKTAPYLMLEKCAVANVMRWAFPEVLGNFYIADEMEKVSSEQANMAPIQVSVPTITQPSVDVPSEPCEEFKPSEDEIDYEKENLKTIMIDTINEQHPEFFKKIERTKEHFIEKIMNENDTDKLIKMFDWIKQVTRL